MIRIGELESLGIRIAAFSDRTDGDCGSLAATFRDRERFLLRCGAPMESLVCPKQVHGTAVLRVGQGERGQGATGPTTSVGAADGLVTNETGIALGVTTADCVPLALAAPERNAIAAVHAGREGTRANIARVAVQTLAREFFVPPSEIHACIGPSAGVCHYEVSEEMAATFSEAGLPVRGRNLDLWEANRIQLIQAGVPGEQIYVDGRCTICDGRFFSYRREGSTARNMLLLMI